MLEYNFKENSFKDYVSKYSYFRGFYITFTIFYCLFIISIMKNSPIEEEYNFHYPLMHGILFVLCLIFMIISEILFRKINSPFDCSNANIEITQMNQIFREKKKTSFIIVIIILSIYLCMIVLEIYLAIMKHIKENKIEEEKKLKEKEKMNAKLINSKHETELGFK